MLLRRRWLLQGLGGVLLTSGAAMAISHGKPARSPRLPSSSQSAVTVYGAEWCGPCKRLKRGLQEQDIPYDYIDIDQNPSAHERAKQATGTSAIPVTNVQRAGNDVWIIGADIDAVARAYRGQ